MKNFAVIIITGLIIFFTGYYLDSQSIPLGFDETPDTTQLVEMELPPFNFKDLNGNDYSISDFKGKIVILNFWASWCGPCLEEFPAILKIVNSYPKEIVLVAISNDESKKDIIKFFKRFDINQKIVNSVLLGYDPNKEISSTIFNVIKLPETFIINRNGKIIRKIVGASLWKDDGLDSFFNKIININQ
jgi:thiol-disulfide isomerase/thioredoxin